MSFGSNLKELRKQAGLTQKQLSEITNFDQGTISGWECGKFSASAEALVILADALQCTVDYLIDREAEDGIINIKYNGYIPNDDELDLLYDYKKLSEEQKRTIKLFIKTLNEK